MVSAKSLGGEVNDPWALGVLGKNQGRQGVIQELGQESF